MKTVTEPTVTESTVTESTRTCEVSGVTYEADQPSMFVGLPLCVGCAGIEDAILCEALEDCGSCESSGDPVIWVAKREVIL